MSKSLESNLDVPNLVKAGIGNRFLILIEILRHPTGLSLPELGPKFPYCNERTTQYHLEKLAETAFVTRVYEKRASTKIEAVYYITPFGVESVQNEMRSLCELMVHIKKEMIKSNQVIGMKLSCANIEETS
jgi:hypothetical protein